MVLHDDNQGGIVCVGQSSHAWISGQIARAWGNRRFSAPEPFEACCLGAEQHDVGMAEWDLSPALDPETGWPVPFTRMPLQTHLELWTAAPHRVITQSPYAALLVSMHGRALYARGSTPEPDVARFVERQERLQAQLIERLGEDPERARRNQRLLWAWDFLSLALLVGWEDDALPTPDGPIAVTVTGTRRISVDPWPFEAPTLAVECAARRLTEPSTTQEELLTRLAASPWLRLECELTPRA